MTLKFAACTLPMRVATQHPVMEERQVSLDGTSCIFWNAACGLLGIAEHADAQCLAYFRATGAGHPWVSSFNCDRHCQTANPDHVHVFGQHPGSIESQFWKKRSFCDGDHCDFCRTSSYLYWGSLFYVDCTESSISSWVVCSQILFDWVKLFKLLIWNVLEQIAKFSFTLARYI